MDKPDITASSSLIKRLSVGGFITLHSRLPRGGSLQARRLANDTVQLYWRYSLDGVTSREPIGPYDSTSPPRKLEPTTRGYGIAAALERCRELAVVHASRATTGGLVAAKAEERRAHRAQMEQDREKSRHTLQKLMDEYVAYLKGLDRGSYADAENIFKNHVTLAWPKFAQTAAADVTPDQFLEVLRKPIEDGKGRTSNKLRSYLRAAYQCALDVRTTAAIPVAFKGFAVVFNPVAQTRRSASYDRADKRPFSKVELRRYWALLRREGVEAATLRLHLLTGCPRIKQFVRLKTAAALDETITLYDIKGRPGQGPRPHVIPLIEPAREEFPRLEMRGEFAFSTTNGKKPISNTTLSNWAHDIVGEGWPDFQMKRLRSGVETLLAGSKVNREIRGHLQSHGLTGVQKRHYDGHDYLEEMHEALELMFFVLEGGEPVRNSRVRDGNDTAIANRPLLVNAQEHEPS